jgi:hypothetical protein
VLRSDQPKVKVDVPDFPVNAMDVSPPVAWQAVSSCASVSSRTKVAVVAAEPVVPFLNEPAVVVPVPPNVAVVGGPAATVVEPGLNLVGAAVLVPVEVYMVVMTPDGMPLASVKQSAPAGTVIVLVPLAAVIVTPFCVRPLLATRALAVTWVVNLVGTVEGVLKLSPGEIVIEPVRCPVSVPAKTTGVVAASLGPLAAITAAAGNARAVAANAMSLNFM